MDNLQQQALDLLDRLQWNQRMHDDLFHTDISNLPPQERLKHLMLHLTKYVCRLTPLLLDNPEKISEIKLIFVDSFNITLSIANVYNVKLSKRVNILKEPGAFTPGDTFRYLTEASVPDNAADLFGDQPCKKLVLDLIAIIGNMAKSLESWDHLEVYDYHTKMREDVVKMFNLHLNLFFYFGINYVPLMVSERLTDIQKRNPFYEQMVNMYLKRIYV